MVSKTKQSNAEESLIDSILPDGTEDFLKWMGEKPDSVSHMAEGATSQFLSRSDRFPTATYPAVKGALEGALRAVERLMGDEDGTAD